MKESISGGNSAGDVLFIFFLTFVANTFILSLVGQNNLRENEKRWNILSSLLPVKGQERFGIEAQFGEIVIMYYPFPSLFASRLLIRST